ncbi:hypothetical protein GCM10009535_38500 [Streptomyces thermocarboxydovorans]|uniref:Uncharacterized protein n=1 Tax=Streptomyces thermocarboxydovorans TaxID=59298 RepID=A0ABN1HK63_9ACTN
MFLGAAPVGGLLLRTGSGEGPLLGAASAEGPLLGAAPVEGLLLGTATGGGLLLGLVTREGLVGAVVAGEGLVGLALRALGDLSGLGEDVAEFAHQALVDGQAVVGRGRACHRAGPSCGRSFRSWAPPRALESQRPAAPRMSRALRDVPETGTRSPLLITALIADGT